MVKYPPFCPVLCLVKKEKNIDLCVSDTMRLCIHALELQAIYHDMWLSYFTQQPYLKVTNQYL